MTAVTDTVGGHVECGECGHPVEEHLPRGCGHVDDGHACRCLQRWTKGQIRRVRKENGLPAERDEPGGRGLL